MCLVFFFGAFGAEKNLRPPTWGWCSFGSGFFLTWFDFDWPLSPGCLNPKNGRKISMFSCDRATLKFMLRQLVGEDKPPRSMGPMLSKHRKTNLSRTIKLDKIMGSWTFMEKIKTLQQLKMTSWFTPQLLGDSKPRTSTKFRRTELWMRPHFFGQNQGSFLF